MNDQVRKKTKTIFDECYRKRRKTFCNMVNVHVCNIGFSSTHGKELITQTIGIPSRIQKDLTMKQMFDISAKLVSEQDEIYGVKTLDWETYSWKFLSLIGDEQVISLLHTKVYVFSDSVLCLGKMNENPRSNIAWEQRLEWFTSSP